MARQAPTPKSDRTVLSTDAAELLEDPGGEKPPTYTGDQILSDDATNGLPVHYRPEYGHDDSNLQQDVTKAFEDADRVDGPAGYLLESDDLGIGIFHTEWLSKYEAGNALKALSEMPVFDFYPQRVAEWVLGLAPNTLVALAREIVDQRLVPAVYTWAQNPAETHQLANASPNSGDLFFDTSDRYPIFSERGVATGDHVLAVPRHWTVSRVLFPESY